MGLILIECGLWCQETDYNCSLLSKVCRIEDTSFPTTSGVDQCVVDEFSFINSTALLCN